MWGKASRLSAGTPSGPCVLWPCALSLAKPRVNSPQSGVTPTHPLVFRGLQDVYKLITLEKKTKTKKNYSTLFPGGIQRGTSGPCLEDSYWEGKGQGHFLSPRFLVSAAPLPHCQASGQQEAMFLAFRT